MDCFYELVFSIDKLSDHSTEIQKTNRVQCIQHGFARLAFESRCLRAMQQKSRSQLMQIPPFSRASSNGKAPLPKSEILRSGNEDKNAQQSPTSLIKSSCQHLLVFFHIFEGNPAIKRTSERPLNWVSPSSVASIPVRRFHFCSTHYRPPPPPLTIKQIKRMM